MSAIDVLEWDCGRCVKALLFDVATFAGLPVTPVALAGGTKFERLFIGHRVRISSTTLTKAVRYGIDVGVTLNLSCDSDFATMLSKVESTRVVRTTVD